MGTQLLPENYSFRIGEPKFVTWVTRPTVQRIRNLKDTQLSISVDGPNGKGKFNATLKDATHTANPKALFQTTFKFTSYDGAVQAMRDLVDGVRNLDF